MLTVIVFTEYCAAGQELGQNRTCTECPVDHYSHNKATMTLNVFTSIIDSIVIQNPFNTNSMYIYIISILHKFHQPKNILKAKNMHF